MATKQNVTATAKKTSTTTKELPLTDPKRKLTREEWATMPKELKAERKAARLAQRGPAKQRISKLVGRYADRFERMQKLLANQKPIHEALVELTSLARVVAADVDGLPDAWVPAGRTPRVAFTIGQHVQLVEARRAHYQQLLGDDLDGLKVVQIAGRNVAVKTPKGTRFVLDAKHVRAAS